MIKFPKFRSNYLYAIDLDGVIIDSIEECYKNTVNTYSIKRFDKKKVKELFYHYRGLVQPAYEYYFLIRAIEEYLSEKKFSVDHIFEEKRKNNSSIVASNFEKNFFINRRKLQKQNMDKWMESNPLTDFGRFLVKEKPCNVVIVTTKNRDSAKKILLYHNIFVEEVFGANQVKNAGSKGKLLDSILTKSIFKKILFIDDSSEHLDTVSNVNIKCYHADWGYGTKDNGYPTYKI